MGNPYYAPIEMYEHSPPPPGVYVDMPYSVITIGTVYVVNQQQAMPTPSCTVPAAFPTDVGASVPCWNGYFDQGDGAVFKNDAQDVQIAGAKLRSQGQASVHFLSGAGSNVRIFGNVLGTFDSASTYNCVNVEQSANTNLHIESNDCTGSRATTPLAYYSPYPSPSPSFYPVVRNNRGTTGVNIPATSGLTITNVGPYDCWYYFNWSGVSGTVTLQYPGTSATSLYAPFPLSIFIPVGAKLNVMSVSYPTYTGFCLQ
jgi:hypothetical protein